jgi:hypothetical protein
MADTHDEPMPGGKKSVYLGCHTITHEAGHTIEIDNSPSDRRIHLYHASGTYIRIEDNGAIVIHAVGPTKEYNESGRDQKVTGDLNITVTGNAKLVYEGNVTQNIKGNYEVNVGGDFKMKADGKNLMEFGGDQRIQVNGKTSHRTSGDRDEITGGNKTVTTNRDHYEGIGGDMNVTSSQDMSLMAGNDIAITGYRQVGIAATEDILSLAAGNQIQTAAKEGTIIKDNSCVQITSFGSNPSFIYNAGTGSAALVGKTGGITLLSGGNIGARIEGTYTARAKGNVTISSLAKNIIKSSGGTDIEATTVAATTGDTPDTTTPTVTMPPWFT